MAYGYMPYGNQYGGYTGYGGRLPSLASSVRSMSTARMEHRRSKWLPIAVLS